MAEVQHTCPHCGHSVGRLMRVDGVGVSNCVSCHKSDWSLRFPFPESAADRARRQAQEARRREPERWQEEQTEGQHRHRAETWPDDEVADDEVVEEEAADENGFTPLEMREREREELAQRVRDEESVKWLKGIVGVVILVVALSMCARSEGNPYDDRTCQWVGRAEECW